jgi:hypothetical protein
MPMVRSPDSIIASQAVMTFGELALVCSSVCLSISLSPSLTTLTHSLPVAPQVSSKELAQNIDVVLPIIINMMQDRSICLRRKIAAVAFGQACQGTSYVITPYFRFPSLFPILSKVKEKER